MKVLPGEHLNRIRGRLKFLYGEDAVPALMDRLEQLVSRYHFAGPKSGVRWDQQDTILITYGDVLEKKGERPLVTLERFLSTYLKGAIRDVHLLPFFPFSSDDGFSVIDYRKVNESLGCWEDVHAIGTEFKLMFDLVLNHVSSKSQWFENFKDGVEPGKGYFIEMEGGTDLSAAVRPRTNPLLTPVESKQGEKWVWTTFSPDQVDLNYSNPDVLFEILDILLSYIDNGAHIIRLDAIAYLWKEPGTSCVNLPQTHEIVKLFRDVMDMLAPEALLLTEANLPHEENMGYFGDGDEANLIYQFSLSPLLLHALYNGTTKYLNLWAADHPPLQPGCSYVNFTASHDGIGVRPLEGIVPDSEIWNLAQDVRGRGGFVSVRTDAGVEDSPYELNITYFDALADPDYPDRRLHVARFLCSQTIMMSLKGIPAIYFHNLIATPNNYRGFVFTGQARTINRRSWREQAILNLLEDPDTNTARVFKEYIRLLGIRSKHPAFHPYGAQRVLDFEDGLFGIERISPDSTESIVVISNLTSEIRTIPYMAVIQVFTKTNIAVSWLELIKGRTIEPTATGKLTMAPYETLWLVVPM